MLHCTNFNIALLFLGLIYQNYAKVIINVRIFNYKNVDNVRHDGQKCENLHWFGDHCDPMFKICVSGENQCDIVLKNINFWKNQRFLHTVFSQPIPYNYFPNSISIYIQVDDHDNFDKPDHIAVFRSNFHIKVLSSTYMNDMAVQPPGINVRLQASVTVRCAENYTGPTCDETLSQYNCNRFCKHGKCVPHKMDMYDCKCQTGWSGESCNKFTTDNCSLLNCKKICNITGNLRECTCVNNESVIETCIEEYFPSKLISTKSSYFSESTQSSIEISSKIRIPETTSTKSQIVKKTEFPQNSDTQPSSNSTSQKNQKLSHEDNSMKLYITSPTIMIICLFLLLCICMIGLLVIVQKWKRKTNLKLRHVSTLQRPLPPIIFERNVPTEKSKYQNNDISTTLRKANLESESCTIPFGYPNRDSHLFLLNKYEVENGDPYEEPIIDNMESLTCETEANESDDSDVYEKPVASRF